MKKLLIFILFLFLLSGCNNKKELILGVSRIDESKVCEEYCTLDLKIISSEELDDISLNNIYSDVTYDYKINKTSKEIKLTEDTEQKMYSYDLSIRVYNPTEIETIDLEIDNEKYTFNIGNFSCLERKTDYTTHLKCYWQKNKNLTSGTVLHTLNFVNMTDEPIIISDVKLRNDTYSTINIRKNLKTDLVSEKKSEEIAYCFIEMDESLYNLSYIIEVSYIYNGKVNDTYFRISDSSEVESVSSIGAYMLVDRSCFVLNE